MNRPRLVDLGLVAVLGSVAASCASRDATPAGTSGGEVAPAKSSLSAPPLPAVDDSIARPQMPLVPTPDPIRVMKYYRLLWETMVS